MQDILRMSPEDFEAAFKKVDASKAPTPVVPEDDPFVEYLKSLPKVIPPVKVK